MHPDASPTVVARGGRASPLGDALSGYSRPLLAVFVVATVATTGVVLGTVDTTAPPPALPVDVAVTGSLAALRIAAGVGLLGGAGSTALATAGLLVRDPRVRPARGLPSLAVAAVAFVTGTAAAHLAVPHVLALSTASTRGTLAATVDPVGLVELALFFPVVVGVGCALPAALVGGVAAGAVPRHTSTRQRGYAALAVVTAAAVLSPTDVATFGLFAVPPFVGFGAGVAWLELR
ncbi:twin-arginine translocase subunit TatC [Salinigranum marinum]|uniref:twin-arginine translocase subunit TatC n=1 Tax=Salinigranum marinum TaxID=1515595 RepID=UPI002989DA02|nr:twin-arginine translocase subunit TatC [Salinigranum marinum]